jgi:hypothetical protein
MLSRTEQVDEFFMVALNLDTQARKTFLESLTSDIREEVQRLLTAYEVFPERKPAHFRMSV